MTRGKREELSTACAQDFPGSDRLGLGFALIEEPYLLRNDTLTLLEITYGANRIITSDRKLAAAHVCMMSNCLHDETSQGYFASEFESVRELQPFLLFRYLHSIKWAFSSIQFTHKGRNFTIRPF